MSLALGHPSPEGAARARRLAPEARRRLRPQPPQDRRPRTSIAPNARTARRSRATDRAPRRRARGRLRRESRHRRAARPRPARVASPLRAPRRSRDRVERGASSAISFGKHEAPGSYPGPAFRLCGHELLGARRLQAPRFPRPGPGPASHGAMVHSAAHCPSRECRASTPFVGEHPGAVDPWTGRSACDTFGSSCAGLAGAVAEEVP